MLFPRLRPLLLLFATLASAQTYTPKTIRVEGSGTLSKADVLRTAQLSEGVPLTREQIEAGLARLGESGSFSDLSYSVTPAALVLKLTPSAANKMLPVRFVNFVWWQRDELMKLVEARVPLFHGELPPSGSLTDQVEAALTALLKDKGINGTVTVVESGGANGPSRIGLAVSRPEIVLGEITVAGSLPVVATKVGHMQAGFRAQEFDSAVTATAIPRNITDVYNNAGFLDAATDPPTFGLPHKDPPGGGDMARYVVDASTTVHPGEPYRIRTLRIDGPPPLTRAELSKAAGVKAGDLAGAFTLVHATDSLANAYERAGYLDAKAALAQPRDPATHTVDCTFSVVPGELYHYARVDVSALPAAQASAFTRVWTLQPGATAGDTVSVALLTALRAIDATKTIRPQTRRDRDDHTVTVVLTPVASHPR